MSKMFYREALRQQRRPAIIIACIFTALKLLCMLYLGVMYDRVSGSLVYELEPIFMLSDLAAMAACAAVLTIKSFSWMYSRTAADCYYQLPMSKASLAMGFLAAAFTWGMLVLLLLTVTSGFLIYAAQSFAGAFSGIDFSDLMAWSIVLLTGIKVLVYVTGAAFLAAAIAGNMASAAVLAAMLAYVPPMLMHLAMAAVTANLTRYVPSLITGEFSSALGDGESYVSFLLLPVTNFVGIDALYMHTAADLLTVLISLLKWSIVGIIYFVIGWFVFRQRNAESADTPAFSYPVHVICRLIPALILSLYITTLVICKVKGRGVTFEITPHKLVIVFGLLAGYLVAAALIYVYELIAVKNISKFKKILPWVFVLALINVVYLGSVLAVRRSIQYDMPSADSISAVTVEQIEHSESNYFAQSLKDYKLDDEAVKQVTSDALKFTVDFCNEYLTGYPDGTQYRSFIVTIEKRFGTIKRRIFLNAAQQEELLKAIENSGTFDEIVESIPDDASESGSQDEQGRAYRIDAHGNFRNANEKELKSFFELYRKEIKAIGFEEAIEPMTAEENTCYMSLYWDEHAEGVLPVDSRTPKSMKMYKQLKEK